MPLGYLRLYSPKELVFIDKHQDVQFVIQDASQFNISNTIMQSVYDESMAYVERVARTLIIG
jgi:hypothetical protein